MYIYIYIYIYNFSQCYNWILVSEILIFAVCDFIEIKGIVNPKIKILSIILLTLKYFQTWGTIDFHSRTQKNTMEANSAPELLCFPTFFRISSFVFSRKIHSIQVYLELLEGE